MARIVGAEGLQRADEAGVYVVVADRWRNLHAFQTIRSSAASHVLGLVDKSIRLQAPNDAEADRGNLSRMPPSVGSSAQESLVGP